MKKTEDTISFKNSQEFVAQQKDNNSKSECLYPNKYTNKRFTIVTESKHFIYFVSEEDKNENWCLKIAVKDKFASKFKNTNYEETTKYKVILKVKLAIRHQPNYMKLNAYSDSPYKMKDLKPEYRKEIKKAIIEDTIEYQNETIHYYDYAIVLWEELNDREKFFLYETPNQELRWTNTPLDKELTGLAMNVELVLQPMGKIENEPPYIIVQNDYDDKHNMNWVKVRLDGKTVNDEELVFDEAELRELKSWIDINKLTILNYWTQEEFSSLEVYKKIRTICAVLPEYGWDRDEWKSDKIIHAKELEEYFKSLKDKIIGKPINKIYYTGILHNRMWDDFYEYDNGEWYQDGAKVNEPNYYPWKTCNVSLVLDSPVILDFESTRLELLYWSGSLVNVNTNTIDTDKRGADVSKHFSTNIIGHKLVDIKINKTDKVYFMNFKHLGIERKDGDDMFEQIWFVFDNGFVLELTTDHCDYTYFSEITPNIYYDFIKDGKF